MNRGVFLDRDGVLNEAPVVGGVPRAPATLAEMKLLADAEPACARLRNEGFLLICITNQVEISRGGASSAEVEAINDRLIEVLGLQEVVVCPHDDEDNCVCRKPKPGMILEAARRHEVDLSRSFTVGDRWRDIEAGRNAGTKTVFVDRDYEERLTVVPDVTVAGLEEASQWIMQQQPQ